MKRILWATMRGTAVLAVATLGAVTAVVTTANAQNARVVLPREMLAFSNNPDAARIGVYLGDSDLRDTLGVLVNSVVEGGPAAQAGIKQGDRIVAIDGVNLRMTRLDAEDAMLNGMMNRRLTRTLDARKAGDEVELQVLSGGSTRSVRIKTVAARDLVASRDRAVNTIRERNTGSERAAFGMSLGGSSTKRDTLGVLVIGITPDGPAEKAGMVEGDRIASINGIDLKVPREDAGDVNVSHARVNRLTREITKLKVGDAATFTVWSGGRQREVRLTAVKASDLGGNFQMFFGDGMIRFPGVEIPKVSIPRFEIDIPNVEVRRIPGGSAFWYRGAASANDSVREQVRRALDESRRAREAAINGVRRSVRTSRG